MSKRYDVLFTTLMAIVIVLNLFAVSSQADDGGNVSAGPLVETQAAVLAYWTPERLASARPAVIALDGQPNPVVDPSPPSGETGLQTSTANGKTSTVLLGDDARAVLALTGAVETEAVPTPTAVYAYPPPQNTFAIPLSWYGSFPLRAVGKVYFSQGGFNFVCSGSAIGGSVVQTAGHCVSDGAGTYSSNVIFKPAHRPSWDAPFGTWVANSLGVRTAWHLNGLPGGFCEDLGCIVTNDIGGNSLAATVGNLGHLYNASRTRHWAIFGYPAAGGWSGEIMVQTEASWNTDDDPGCVSGPDTIGVGWGQAGGSSGGPWVDTYRPQQSGANNYVNGVTSYIYTAQPNQIFSPYFGNEFKSHYDFCQAL